MSPPGGGRVGGVMVKFKGVRDRVRLGIGGTGIDVVSILAGLDTSS